MHLAECRECRLALREYDWVARVAMPSMADDFPVPLPDDPEDWSEEGAREEFFERLDLANTSSSAGPDLQYRSNRLRIEIKLPKGNGTIWAIRLALTYS